MNSDRWNRISEIFQKALAVPRPQRETFLQHECLDDSSLRSEVDSLLAAHEAAGSQFLNAPEVHPEAPGSSGFSAAVHTGSRIGPYLVEEKIGHGGMGEVYAARRADGQYEKRVALKLVRAGYDRSLVIERFRTERQILAGLDHPNVARLLDGGTSDGRPYLVMELVEGVPIDTYCDAQRLSITQRLVLFREVCSAVQYAHQRLVIHRDIKPSNILVTKEGLPKLLDFGIAKLLDASGSTEATLLQPMTPQYASPEQVRGEPISTATDVYSLGVVLYQLLTGRSPYRVDTRTPAKLAEAITSEEPEKPSTSVGRAVETTADGETNALTLESVSGTREASPVRLQNRLRGDLDFILLKALRKEPAQRYSSVEQFSEDLRRHLEGLPVTARKGTWSYKAGKFAKRHKTSLAAAALVLLAISAGLAATIREARIAQRRFNDVRKLANSLIFEVHDSIQNLPGATQARKLVLQRSLEYLDSLEKDSGNDPDLRRELATAYSRIGSLQGNPLDPNLGDTKGAVASLQKSMGLRESLARSNPRNSKDQLELAVAYLDYSDVQRGGAGNTSVSYDYYQKAVAILDREEISSPNDVRLVAQETRAYTNMGMIEIGEGPAASVDRTEDGIAHLKQALVWDQRASQLAPTNLMFASQEATITVVLGDAEVKSGHNDEALNHYRDALRILEGLKAKDNNIRIAANANVLVDKIGAVFVSLEKFPEALTYFKQAQQSDALLLAADPQNQLLRQESIASSAQLGHALADSGQPEEGLKYLRHCQEMIAQASQSAMIRVQQVVVEAWIGEAFERGGRMREASLQYAKVKGSFKELLVAGMDDVRFHGYFASACDRLANTLVELGELDEARKTYEEARTYLEPLVNAKPKEQELSYPLAEIYTGEGTLSAKMAAASKSRKEATKNWQGACDWYQKSLKVWQTIPNPTHHNYSGVESTLPAEVSRRLARCQGNLNALQNAPRN